MYFHILTGINIDVQGLAYNELYPCKGSVLTILIRRKGREYLERSALFTGHGFNTLVSDLAFKLHNSFQTVWERGVVLLNGSFRTEIEIKILFHLLDKEISMNSDTASCLIVGSCSLVTFSRYSNMKFLDTLVLSLNRNDDSKSKEFSGPLEKVCGYRSTIKILFCPFIKLNNG